VTHESNHIRAIRGNGEYINQDAETLAEKTINRSAFTFYPAWYSSIILGTRSKGMVIQSRTIINTHHI
ncbi:hypothetical protein, partial [Escherichia coli]|uniref:hypothetical protein n=1 Tax=Escherichia coli TaxID=562 RepID=UPI001BAEE1F1